ncbi:MAG: nuclear transport factor 2 family protein [Gemmatimonadaceae bacterium]
MHFVIRRSAPTLALLASISLLTTRAVAQKTAPHPTSPAAEREAVRQAVLQYVDGFYEGDSTKLVNVLRPELYKYGFDWNAKAGRYEGSQMTWSEAMAFANHVKASNRAARPGSPKEVTLLDVSDQTASAKLKAWWGMDYLLLAKFEGKWMISHVLWQSAPPGA